MDQVDPHFRQQTPPYALNPIRHLPSPHQSSPNPSLLSHDQPNGPYYAGACHHGHPIPRSQTSHLPFPDNARTTGPKASSTISQQVKGDKNESTKRPRSCEACRALKVRCERDPSSNLPCKRCAKADRKCILTEPSHKRRKKTDSKVAELEKKIDALQASLIAAREGNGRGSESDSSEDEESLQLHSEVGPMPEGRNRKRRRSAYQQSDLASPLPAGKASSHLPRSSFIHAPPVPSPATSAHPHEYADVVDRHILSSAAATEIFQYYREKMAPYMPAVTFPPLITAGDIRRTKPVLFLAILSVASGQKYPDIQRVLIREATQAYAERIIRKGEKSLELIQAIQVSTVWHLWEDENDTRAFQLIHMAATMGMALMFAHDNTDSNVFKMRIRQGPRSILNEDCGGPTERKRAWVSNYVLCGRYVSTCVLREPILTSLDDTAAQWESSNRI